MAGQESAPPRCANNCGFFGNPATLNLCSVCFLKHRLLNGAPIAAASLAPSAAKHGVPKAVVSTDATVSVTKDVSEAPVATVAAVTKDVSEAPVATVAAAVSSSRAEAPAKAAPNRCATCQKRVGLTGFVCRCGVTLCGMHRYPEKHGCSFDFMAAGRDAIARDNPLVKGEKLKDKI